MSENPSTKWFWNDWDNDRALALCSLAAQGIWMRMLSIAARSDGYLRVNGKACSIDELSVLIGHPASEIAPLVAELDARGVFSRTRDGTIYSRRIVRDEKNRKFFQKKGKEGGNPKLLASASDKGKKTDPLIPPVIPPLNGGGSPPIPYSLSPKEDSVVAIAPTAGANPDQPVAVVVVVEPSEPVPARDYVKETFDMSVEIFGPKGRALVGKALKNTRDSFVVLDALYATKRECIGDPVEFFMGAIKWRMGNGRQSAHAAETAAFDAITRH